MLSPYIVEVNQNNFREVFEGSVNTPILFHFWAPMSQESAQIIPELQTLTQQHNGAFTLALLNCQEEQAVALFGPFHLREPLFVLPSRLPSSAPLEFEKREPPCLVRR